MTSRALATAREWGAGASFGLRLPRFVRRTLTVDESRRLVREGLERRDERFLFVLEHGVYARSRSPYLPLLRAAGAELGDVAALVRRDGLQAALERLYDAGVHLSLEEFKGRRPIERPGVSTWARAEDFDSPLVGKVVSGSDVGSHGAPRRVIVALEDVEHTAAYTALFFSAVGLFERPIALWRPLPPGRAGVGHVVQLAKLGKRIDAWFSQSRLRAFTRPKEALFTYGTLAGVRAGGMPVPWPRHVPLERAVHVARWLADHSPAHLNAPASSAVRVCLAALDAGIDVSGAFFRVGGEPLTAGKAAVFERASARVACHYTMSDIGRVGVACAAPEALDDVHLVTDRLAVIERERPVGGDGTVVRSLHYTSVAPSARRIFLNVESGDYATLTRRQCGCPLGQVGLDLHLHTIRSFEKLTTEGMHFLGVDLLDVVERVLPARFGGSATDYQLVEEEDEGLPRIRIVVHPNVGDIDGSAVVDTVLEALGGGPASKNMMAGIWRDGQTLSVVRRRPSPTASGKILPLHRGSR